MAKTSISDEELQLRKRARRRLVGAIVLVLLVVVLVPMFLEREPRLQKHDMDIRIPPIPGQTQAPSIPTATPAPVPAEKVEAPPQPAMPPAPEPPARSPASSSATETRLPEAPAAKQPPAATQRATPAPQSRNEAQNKVPALTPSKELADAEGYIVQLGAFSSSANAKQLLHKLKVEKFPAYTEAVKTTQGEKTRVRVGPYPSIEVAEKARDRMKTLKLVFGNDARVMRAGE